MNQWASNISEEDRQAAAAPSRPIAFEDAVLVERCRKGDMDAFGSLVAKYQDRIFNLIYRMCGRGSDAEELAQETFLKALERIGQFRGGSQFYTWLFRIAANLAITQRRRAGRIKFGSLEGGEDSEGQADALSAAAQREPSPEAAAMSADTGRRVAQALDELDDEFRLVVVLRDVEEMDYAEISDVLGVPAGTVKSRLHRARAILKDRLADLM